jgi:hypothetical protein
MFDPRQEVTVSDQSTLDALKEKARRSISCALKTLGQPISEKIANSLFNDPKLQTALKNVTVYSISIPDQKGLFGFSVGTNLFINTGADLETIPSSFAGTQEQFIAGTIWHELDHTQHHADPASFAIAAAALGITDINNITKIQEEAITRLQTDQWMTANGFSPIYGFRNFSDYIEQTTQDNSKGNYNGVWTATPGASSNQINDAMNKAYNVTLANATNLDDCK